MNPPAPTQSASIFYNDQGLLVNSQGKIIIFKRVGGNTWGSLTRTGDSDDKTTCTFQEREQGEGTIIGPEIGNRHGSNFEFEGVEYQVWDNFMSILISPIIEPI